MDTLANHIPAVRNGDLVLFGDVLDKYGHQFQAEKTYTLIIRLRHNVIKTGIRIISLSYSRISLADIAEKLQLDSAEDAEYIVAKVGNISPLGSQFSKRVYFRPFYCLTNLITTCTAMNIILESELLHVSPNVAPCDHLCQAIRDGVIEANIDHERGFMRSKVRVLSRRAHRSVKNVHSPLPSPPPTLPNTHTLHFHV